MSEGRRDQPGTPLARSVLEGVAAAYIWGWEHCGGAHRSSCRRPLVPVHLRRPGRLGAGAGRGIKEGHGRAIFPGKPVVGQMQVDPGVSIEA